MESEHLISASISTNVALSLAAKYQKILYTVNVLTFVFGLLILSVAAATQQLVASRCELSFTRKKRSTSFANSSELQCRPGHSTWRLRSAASSLSSPFAVMPPGFRQVPENCAQTSGCLGAMRAPNLVVNNKRNYALWVYLAFLFLGLIMQLVVAGFLLQLSGVIRNASVVRARFSACAL